MSTPITDGLYNPEKGWTGVVPLDHARRLELDRAALMEALEWMLASGTPSQKCGGHGGSSCCCSCAPEKARAAISAARANFPIP